MVEEGVTNYEKWPKFSLELLSQLKVTCNFSAIFPTLQPAKRPSAQYSVKQLPQTGEVILFKTRHKVWLEVMARKMVNRLGFEVSSGRRVEVLESNGTNHRKISKWKLQHQQNIGHKAIPTSLFVQKHSHKLWVIWREEFSFR